MMFPLTSKEIKKSRVGVSEPTRGDKLKLARPAKPGDVFLSQVLDAKSPPSPAVKHEREVEPRPVDILLAQVSVSSPHETGNEKHTAITTKNSETESEAEADDDDEVGENENESKMKALDEVVHKVSALYNSGYLTLPC